MKLSIGKILLISLLSLSFAGCKKNYVISDKQRILFQFEYINYAWGYHHNGFIIDNDGNILTYNNPEEWNFADKDMSLTESQVSENIRKCISTGDKISADDLKKYTGYIKNIASTKLSALKNAGADAGSLEYICYQYSESTGMYKGYLIKMEGDFTCENLNFYSKKVATWMKDINNNISHN
jgi:hypothetical protein